MQMEQPCSVRFRLQNALPVVETSLFVCHDANNALYYVLVRMWVVVVFRDVPTINMYNLMNW